MCICKKVKREIKDRSNYHGYYHNLERWEAVEYLKETLEEAFQIKPETTAIAVTATLHYLDQEKKAFGVKKVEKIIDYFDLSKDPRGQIRMPYRKYF